ncbi:hypothetical protein J2T15_003231 [Paenibacillus harenae]|uniref:ROK family protein n=1 Tax=Paenibacillus harenae TaxID=306543 RepID=A0ABT9U2E7_PAEHA|nr:hypothetical protein [Paenibacillus harenae]
MRMGAIEAGGTKFVCGIGNEQGIIEERIGFPTGQPVKVSFRFRRQCRLCGALALGLRLWKISYSIFGL